MRIPATNCTIPYNSLVKRNEASCYSQVNFEGTLTINQLKKYPLDKKLTNLFSICNTNDLIVVGKSFEEIAKGLSRNAKHFTEIIKRIFFIKHGGLSVPLAFGISDKESWTTINIGDKPVVINTGEVLEEFAPAETCLIDEGDIIFNRNVDIPISFRTNFSEYLKDVDDMQLLSDPNNYASRTVTLGNIQQKNIEGANVNALGSLQEIQSEETEVNLIKKLSFKDVGGLEHVIEKLKDAILFPIKFSYAYEEDGVDVNKGVLLYGRPGTGKTLIAEALAGESNAEFIKISGTDFESKYYGDTEKAWRDLFAKAKEKQPSIIFVDEIDAVTKERGEGSNNQHNDKVVTQILTLMSDLEKSDNKVFVIATTNKPKTMDSAILRSGRFGEIIEVTEPNREGKKAILDIHTRKKRLDPNMDIEKLIDEFEKRTFTGADIKHVTNKAHKESWRRQGVRAKMENGTLTREDLVGTCINAEDFNAALADWDSTQISRNKRNPIGYSK